MRKTGIKWLEQFWYARLLIVRRWSISTQVNSCVYLLHAACTIWGGLRATYTTTNTANCWAADTTLIDTTPLALRHWRTTVRLIPPFLWSMFFVITSHCRLYFVVYATGSTQDFLVLRSIHFVARCFRATVVCNDRIRKHHVAHLARQRPAR